MYVASDRLFQTQLIIPNCFQIQLLDVHIWKTDVPKMKQCVLIQCGHLTFMWEHCQQMFSGFFLWRSPEKDHSVHKMASEGEFNCSLLYPFLCSTNCCSIWMFLYSKYIIITNCNNSCQLPHEENRLFLVWYSKTHSSKDLDRKYVLSFHS